MMCFELKLSLSREALIREMVPRRGILFHVQPHDIFGIKFQEKLLAPMLAPGLFYWSGSSPLFKWDDRRRSPEHYGAQVRLSMSGPSACSHRSWNSVPCLDVSSKPNFATRSLFLQPSVS